MTNIQKSVRTAVMALSVILFVCMPVSSGGTSTSKRTKPAAIKETAGTAQVYLYGEAHGNKRILNREFEIWQEYYRSGMRHLFVELPYFTTGYLNLWMHDKDDSILDEVFEDMTGTAGCNPFSYEFYKKIKEQCPETVFHGTDIGHQYTSIGKQYLKYLTDTGQQNSEPYERTLEAIRQGIRFYSVKKGAATYRENTMVFNFIRELNSIQDSAIMGIYGSAHTSLSALGWGIDVPCMAAQLASRYGDVIHSVDLEKDITPVRIDTMQVGGILFTADYYGKQDLRGFKNFVSRDVWRLEGAYDLFKNNAKTGDYLPCDEYPMLIEKGQVFVLDYTLTDGSVYRMYYRSDGTLNDHEPVTENFTIGQFRI